MAIAKCASGGGDLFIFEDDTLFSSHNRPKKYTEKLSLHMSSLRRTA
ncbi:hypothetical protein PsWM33_03072 [Pseudovibrio sp. WM33]|nr:hypothetical protein PsWM33_03072 [Pseudovibrio sp. WM33]